MVKARGDTPNEHDILTGSDLVGMYSTAGGAGLIYCVTAN
jgi:hypothetical protein